MRVSVSKLSRRECFPYRPVGLRPSPDNTAVLTKQWESTAISKRRKMYVNQPVAKHTGFKISVPFSRLFNLLVSEDSATYLT